MPRNERAISDSIDFYLFITTGQTDNAIGNAWKYAFPLIDIDSEQ